MKVVSLKEKIANDAQWPADCLLERINDFDEVLILAKKKGEDSYVRFSSELKSTFWWIGVLEAMKRMLMDESLTETDI